MQWAVSRAPHNPKQTLSAFSRVYIYMNPSMHATEFRVEGLGFRNTAQHTSHLASCLRDLDLRLMSPRSSPTALLLLFIFKHKRN